MKNKKEKYQTSRFKRIPIKGRSVAISIKPSSQMSVALIAKWFLFSAVGLRLLQAGLRYVSWINVSLGILALLATFNTSLKLPVTIIACIYFLISTIRQSSKQPTTLNEWMELLTDAVVFFVLAACILIYTMQ